MSEKRNPATDVIDTLQGMKAPFGILLPDVNLLCGNQGRGVHVTGVSAAYTFKLNKNILSE
jgi:hypothetical protein